MSESHSHDDGIGIGIDPNLSTVLTLHDPIVEEGGVQFLPTFKKKPSAMIPKSRKATPTTVETMFVSSNDSESNTPEIVDQKIPKSKNDQLCTRKAPYRPQQPVFEKRQRATMPKKGTADLASKAEACDQCFDQRRKCPAASETWKGRQCLPCRVSYIRCTFRGEEMDRLSRAQMVSKRVRTDTEEDEDDRDEPKVRSTLRFLKLAETYPKVSKIAESGKSYSHTFSRALKQAQEKLDDMHDDRNIPERDRMKQQDLVQKLQTSAPSGEPRVFEDRASASLMPYTGAIANLNHSRPQSDNNPRLTAGENPYGFFSSRATQSYKNHHIILLDMITNGADDEDIDRQTQIVERLRQRLKDQGRPVTSDTLIPAAEELGGEYVRTDSGFVYLPGLNSEVIDLVGDDELDNHGSVAVSRLMDKSRREEAAIAVPASCPTQLPRDIRNQKNLDAEDIINNTKIHTTFDPKFTHRDDRHNRKINTTNKSTINNRQPPPSRSRKRRIRMPSSSRVRPRTEGPHSLSAKNMIQLRPTCEEDDQNPENGFSDYDSFDLDSGEVEAVRNYDGV